MSLFNFFDNRYILIKNFTSKNISSIVTGKLQLENIFFNYF